MGVWTFRKESFYVSNLSSQIFNITGPPFPSQLRTATTLVKQKSMPAE